jgi:Na+-transporting methylmalonyl-CoA/oxaloacetate decarboxylase gamma subunit
MSADGHDQWHQHTAAEGMPQQEHTAQASAKALGLTIIGMTLGVLFVILVLVVYFQNYMSNYKASINENTEAAAATWNEKQEVFASIYGPVDSAIELVVSDYASEN